MTHAATRRVNRVKHATMGKIGEFLNNKPWHPSSRQNQTLLFEAEERQREEQQRLEERQEELKQERAREELEEQRLARALDVEAVPASRSSSTAAWSSVVAASSSLESSEELMCTACLNNLLAACASARLYCLSSNACKRLAALCAEEASDRSFPAVIFPGAAPPAMPSRTAVSSSSWF